MAQVKIIAKSIVITSNLTTEVIKNVEAINPSGLVLVESCEGETTEVFRIATGSKASFNKYGIVFDGTNSRGFAQATILTDTAMTAEEVKNKYGLALINLNDLEDVVKSEYKNLKEKLDTLDKDITEVA